MTSTNFEGGGIFGSSVKRLWQMFASPMHDFLHHREVIAHSLEEEKLCHFKKACSEFTTNVSGSFSGPTFLAFYLCAVFFQIINE